jgi:hypothetical protein
VHRDHEGVLAPGAPATFAIWSTVDGIGPSGLPNLDALPRCEQTVLRGTTIYSSDTA